MQFSIKVDSSYNRTKVFIVDDEVTITKILSNIVSKHFDVEIKVANSFKEAKEVFKKWQPQICFFDINLGDGSGYELIQFGKREQKNECFVVMMSAYAKEVEMDEAMKRGADFFIAKPFEREKLINLVTGCISSRQQ